MWDADQTADASKAEDPKELLSSLEKPQAGEGDLTAGDGSILSPALSWKNYPTFLSIQSLYTDGRHRPLFVRAAMACIAMDSSQFIFLSDVCCYLG